MTEMQLKKNTLLETVRSNQAKELETNRSNLAREEETHRSNLAQEGFKDRETTVKENTYQMEKDFQPYRKIESVTKSISNAATAVTGKKGLSSLANDQGWTYENKPQLIY